MHKKQSFTRQRLFLVIISRSIMFSTLFTLFFTTFSYGNSNSFEIKMSLYVEAPEGSLLETQESQPRLRLLELSPSLFFEKWRVLLTQIDEDKIRVDLRQPLRIGFYDSEGTKNLKLESFVIVDTPDKIEKIMSLREGTLFTRDSVKDRQLEKFIRSLSPMGFTKAMTKYLEEGPPMGILKVSSFSASVSVLDLIQGKAKLKFPHYLSEIIIGSRLYDIPLKMLPVQLDVIEKTLDENDPRVKEYKEVFGEYKSRYRLMSQRGWLKGLKPPEVSEFETSVGEKVDNVVSLFGGKTCESLFKPK